MSVRERMEQLEEEMDARFQRKIEIKTLREWLAEDGYIPPENPSDVSVELRTLLDHLASLGVVVEFADHLSDRELYGWLNEQLGGHMALMPGSILHFDVIGSGSDEDRLMYLTYYASDTERARWKADYPDEELPPRKRPLYNRDLASSKMILTTPSERNERASLADQALSEFFLYPSPSVVR